LFIDRKKKKKPKRDQSYYIHLHHFVASMKHRLYAKQKKYFLDTKIYISSTKYFFGFPPKKNQRKGDVAGHPEL